MICMTHRFVLTSLLSIKKLLLLLLLFFNNHVGDLMSHAQVNSVITYPVTGVAAQLA